MVTSKKKFCCGQGNVLSHYCDICGRPYGDLEDAMDCERGCVRAQREKSKS